MSTPVRLYCEFERILFLQAHRETDRFFATSGVEHAQTNNQDNFRFRGAAFYSHPKSKVGNILVKVTALSINLNIDGANPRAHTHPSHSQPSHLLFTSLSLGTPFPHCTYCMRGFDLLQL